MNFRTNYIHPTARRTQSESQVASFMATVYLWMSLGVAVSAEVAHGVGTHPVLMATLMDTWLIWPVLLVPFGLVFLLKLRSRTMHPAAAGFWYLITTAVMGVWLCGISSQAVEDPKFAGAVGLSLFTSSAMFGGMAIVGWTIRKDLQVWGTFLSSCLLGLLAALIAGIFIQSGTFDFWVSIVGVLLFSALIAFDVQKAKLNSDQGFGGAILSALDLYLDIINLFLNLLRIFSNSSSDD